MMHTQSNALTKCFQMAVRLSTIGNVARTCAFQVRGFSLRVERKAADLKKQVCATNVDKPRTPKPGGPRYLNVNPTRNSTS